MSSADVKSWTKTYTLTLPLGKLGVPHVSRRKGCTVKIKLVIIDLSICLGVAAVGGAAIAIAMNIAL